MPSPIESVLGTNYIPSERERAIVKEYLITTENSLAELEDQVARQKSLLQQLEAQRDGQRANVNAHRAIISPFRRFPDDILREIFLHCLPQRHDATLCASDAPILLGHICGRWRQLSLSTPRLWSSLHIVSYSKYENPSDLKVQARDAIIAEWLTRAGALPFSLTIVPPDPLALRRTAVANVRNAKDAANLLPTIAQLSPRLRSLSLAVIGSAVDIKNLHDKASADIYCRAENLQDLYLDLASGDTSDSPHILEAHNRILSHLRLLKPGTRLHLKLSSFSLNTLTNLPQLIPCAQIRDLSIQTPIPLPVTMDLLQHCPNLITFRASVVRYPVHPTPQPAASDDGIVVQSLKHVSLTLPDFGNLSGVDFIAKCQWPSLTSLHLYAKRRGERLHVLSTVLVRFGASLTSLKINLDDIASDACIGFLSALPNIVQLEMEKGSSLPWREEDPSDDDDDVGQDQDQVIESLTPKEDGSTPYSCPHLQYLKFAPWHSFTRFSDKALATLLLARSSSPYSPVALKQVHIEFQRKMQYDILPECSNLLNAGLDLRLRYRDPGRSSPEPHFIHPNTNTDAVHEDPLLLGWD